MKGIFSMFFSAFLAASLLCGCSRDEAVKMDSLRISETSFRIQLGNYHTLTVDAVNGGEAVLIDNRDVSWESSDPSVVTVMNGVLYGKKTGSAVITAEYNGYADDVKVICRDGVTSTGIDAHFSNENLYDMGHRLTRTIGIQHFDLDASGNVYYAYVNNPQFYETWIEKVKPNQSGSDKVEGAMCVYYGGHLTGMSVETAENGDVYIWCPNYAKKYPETSSSYPKEYWNMRTVCRVKFQPGKKILPTDASVEHFYLPQSGSFNVAVDPEHDILAVCFHNNMILGRTRRVRMYRLSEAMALVPKPIQIENYRYGGHGAPDLVTGETIDEREQTITITARNLEELTHFAEVGTHTSAQSPTDINYYAWQGFDVYGSNVYFIEGSAVKNMGGSRAALTIYNFDDTLFEPREYVRVVQDAEELERFGITETGSMEAEGVQANADGLFLGFSSWGFQGNDEVRANVFKYNLPNAE